MARPTNKEELLKFSSAKFDDLNALINSLSEETRVREFPEGTMNRNIRDVLGHLHQWHSMLLEWYAVGMQGKKPDMPATGFTWKDTSALNKRIWEDNLKVSLVDMRGNFEKTHQNIHDIIEKHTNEELFEKMKYKWTGSTSLGAYLISATSSHYDWAIKLIKKSLK
jgi:hypothetical protein